MGNGWYKILNGCKRIFSYFWECIFPNFCLECNQEGEWWCDGCRQKFPFKFIISSPHNLGQDKIYLDRVLAFFNYDEHCPPARLLKQFKYGYVRSIESVWKSTIVDQSDKLLSYQDYAVVSVPLHSQRERERGFNQAHVLAKLVQGLPGWKGELNSVDLKRIRYTECQAGLGRVERLGNLRDAFLWVGVVVPNKVLLVDDVYTTGTTMNECAKILKKAGVKEVIGLVLAKGNV